jgi:bifunctional N-acetylglucosamine-1-phosphate-uridyltransferase/glucosamine-1-phosphate-acetyltransferase GlmU-like protein
MNKNWSAIIPAAGNSKRFKYRLSKIFYRIDKKTLIETIINKISDYCDDIILIIRKKDRIRLLNILKKIRNKNKIYLAIQEKPRGMGQAVNIGLKKVINKNFFVIWADQLYLKKKTVKKTLKNHIQNNNLLTFPIVKRKNPYTLVLFKKKKFSNIIQQRESPFKLKSGYSDCGFFAGKTMKFRELLKKLIIKNKILTEITKEHDFLHCFKYLKPKHKIELIKINNKIECRGVNYLKDVKK